MDGVFDVRADGRGVARRRGNVALDWEESGRPPVARPTKKGFGSRVLEELVVSDLEGCTKFNFDVSGERCNITAS